MGAWAVVVEGGAEISGKAVSGLIYPGALILFTEIDNEALPQEQFRRCMACRMGRKWQLVARSTLVESLSWHVTSTPPSPPKRLIEEGQNSVCQTEILPQNSNVKGLLSFFPLIQSCTVSCNIKCIIRTLLSRSIAILLCRRDPYRLKQEAPFRKSPYSSSMFKILSSECPDELERNSVMY